jgi:hypothetical protein
MYEQSPTHAGNSGGTESQKLRFSIAHIMGFMGNTANASSPKAADDKEKAEAASEAAGDDRRPATQLPKLWRPTPTREYITAAAAAAADLSAMALLSRFVDFMNHFQLYSFRENWNCM